MSEFFAPATNRMPDPGFESGALVLSAASALSVAGPSPGARTLNAGNADVAGGGVGQGLFGIDARIGAMPLEGLTLCAWVKLLDAPLENGDIVMLGSDVEGNGYLRLNFQPGFSLLAILGTSTGIEFMSEHPDASSVAVGEWHHYAAVFGEGGDEFSLGTMTIYLDGVAGLPNSPWPSRDLGPQNLNLRAVGADWGRHQSDAHVYQSISYHPGFPAAFNHVAVFHRALSAAEIADVYANDAAGASPDSMWLLHGDALPEPDWTGNGPALALPPTHPEDTAEADHAPVDEPSPTGPTTIPDVRITEDQDPVIRGERSLRVGYEDAPAAGSGTDPAVRVAVDVPAAEGSVWSLSASVGFCANVAAVLGVEFLTDATARTVLGSHWAESPADALAGQLWIAGMVAPTLTTVLSVVLGVYRTGPADAPGSATFDDIMLTAGPNVLPAVNGDEGGSRWDGPRFYSTSSRRGEAEGLAVVRDWMPPMWYADPAA